MLTVKNLPVQIVGVANGGISECAMVRCLFDNGRTAWVFPHLIDQTENGEVWNARMTAPILNGRMTRAQRATAEHQASVTAQRIAGNKPYTNTAEDIRQIVANSYRPEVSA